MPNELIVGAVKPLTGSAEKSADPKTGTFPSPSAGTPAEARQLYANPTLNFDSTLGLLVIEFRDSSGNISTSIPSQRQLEAYRLHEVPLPGRKIAEPVPVGGTGSSGASGEPTTEPAAGRAAASPTAAEIAAAVRVVATIQTPAARIPEPPGPASAGLPAVSSSG